MAEFRDYLVLLNNDPSDAHALAALQQLPPAVFASAEAAAALDEARTSLRGQGAAETAVELFDMELPHAASERQTYLLLEKAQIVFEDLLNAGSGVDCLNEALNLDPQNASAIEQLKHLELVKAHWEEIVEKFLVEAEATTEKTLATTLYRAAAENFTRYQPQAAECEEYLRKALEVDPSNQRASRQLTRYLRQGERWSDLQTHLEVSVVKADKKETRKTGWFQLAELALGPLDNSGLAAEAMQQVSALEPGNAKALAFLWERFSSEENWAAAAALLENAFTALRRTASQELKVDLLVRLGTVHWQHLHAPETADKYFDQLRKLDAAHSAHLDFYRTYYVETAQAGKLMQLYRQALKAVAVTDPERKTVLTMELAKLSEGSMDNPERAIDSWKSILRADPTNTEAIESLRRLFERTGKWNALLDLIKEEVERRPSDDVEGRIAGLLEVVEIYRDRLKLDVMVVNTYNSILTLAPSNLSVLDALAAKYKELGRWNDLIAVLGRRAKVDTVDQEERVALLSQIASIWIDRFGNYAQAIKPLEELVALDVHNAEAVTRLKDIYTRRRQWRALIALQGQEAETLAVPERRLHYAEMARLAGEKLGDTRLSINIWNRVLELPGSTVDPDDIAADTPAVYDALCALYEREKRYPAVVEILSRKRMLAVTAEAALPVLESLGVLYADKLKAPTLAAQVYREILELKPSHGKAARVLRELYATARDYESLESLYGELGHWDELIETYFVLSDKFEDRADAIDLLERAGRVAATHIANPDKVARVYERLHSVAPKHIGAAHALGPLYRELGKWSRLIGINELLLEQADVAEQLPLMNDIRELYETQLGSKSRAFQWTVKAYTLSPEPALLADLQRLGAESEAWEEVLGVLDARVKDPDIVDDEKVELLLELGRIADQRLHQPESAQGYYTLVLEMRPDQRSALDALEELATHQNEWPALLAILAKRVDLETDVASQVEMLFKIAHIEEERQEDAEAAIASYKKILVLETDNRRALRVLARLQEALGDWAELAITLEREVAITSDSDAEAALHFRLGELYQGTLSRLGDAREAFKHSLRLAPSTQVHDALEGFLAEEFEAEVRKEVAELLLPAFEESTSHAKIANAMEILLDSADSQQREEYEIRLADLYDTQLQEPGKAFEASARLMVLRPDLLENRTRLGSLGRQLDRLSELRDALEAGYVSSEDKGLDPSFRLHIAEEFAVLCDDDLRDAEAAIVAWKRVVELEEGHEGAFAAMSRLLRTSEAWAELVTLLERHAERSLDSGERVRIYWQIAELCEGPMQDPVGADAAFARIIEADPLQARAYDALAQSHEESQRWSELEQLLAQRADYLEGEDLESNDNRRAQIRANQLDQMSEAVDLAEELIARRPGNLVARELCEQLLSSHNHSLRVAQILEPVYAAEELWQPLCDVLGAQSAFAEAPAEAADLLIRIAGIQEDQLEKTKDANATWLAALKKAPDDQRTLPALVRLAPEVDGWSALVDALMVAAEEVDSGNLATMATLLRTAAEILQEHLADPERAIMALGQLVELDGVEPETLHYASGELDRLYGASGQADKQVGVLRRASEWADSSDERKAILARIAEIEEIALEDQDAALCTWEQVLGEDSEDAMALASSERLLQAAGRFREMVEIVRRRADLVVDVSERSEALVYLADVYLDKLEEGNEAILCLLDVLDLDVDESPILTKLGSLYLSESRYDELFDVLERQIVAAEGEQRAALLYRSGELLAEELARPVEALEHFADVLRMMPDHAAARERLAGLIHDADLGRRAAEILIPLYEAGELYEELIALLKSLAENSDDVRVTLTHLRRIASLEEVQLGDSERAFVTMSAAVRSAVAETELPEVLADLQRLAAENGSLDVLVAVYRDIAPDVFDGDLQRRLYLDIADLSRAVLHDDTTAREYYRLVLEAQPEDKRALTALEGICRDQEDYAALYEILVQKAELAGDDLEASANAIHEAGVLCVEHLDRVDDALMHWQRVLELMPDAREVASKLQQLYRDSGRWHDLAEALESRLGFALSVQEAVDTRFLLGKLHEEHLNDPDGAVENYGAALGGDPSNLQAKEALLRLLDEPGTQNAAADILEPIYVAQQDWPQLVRIYEIKLEGADDSVERLRITKYIARLYEDQLEDLEGAFRWLGRVFRESPSDQQVRTQLERLATHLECWERLAEVYQEYLNDENADTAEVRDVAATLAEVYYRRLNQVERALDAYRRVLQVTPDDLQVFAQTETMLVSSERWPELVGLYEDVVLGTLDEARQLSLYGKLAVIHEQKLGDNVKAVEALRALLDIDSENDSAISELDRLLDALEDWHALSELLLGQIDRAQSDAHVMAARLRLAQLRERRLEDLDGAIDEYALVLDMPDGELALTALERLVMDERCQERIAEILEGVYRTKDHWQKLVVILDAQLNYVDDSVRRGGILREIADIHEDRGGDLSLALTALGKAWLEEVGDSALYERFTELGMRLSDWSVLTDTLEAALKDLYDYDLVGEILLKLAQVAEQGRSDTAAAIAFLVRLLEVSEEHEVALGELDRLYLAQGSWDALVKIIEKRSELAMDPTDALVLLRRAAVMHDEKRRDSLAAIAAFNLILSNEPEDPGALDALERLYVVDENWNELAQILLTKIEVCLENSLGRTLHFQLADLYVAHLNDSYEAIAQIRQVLEEEPADQEALARLRVLLEKEEMWPDLLEIIDRQAEACSAEERVAHMYDAAQLLEEKLTELDGAVERYAAILGMQPSHEGSREALERHKADDDLMARACEVLESVYRDEGNFNALVPVYERRIDASEGDLPTRGTLFTALAKIHEADRKDLPTAFATWARAVQDNVEDEYFQTELERLAAAEASWSQLVTIYEALLHESSDAQLEGQLALKLGRLYEENMGDLGLAAERFEQAHRVVDDVNTPLAALARIYQRDLKFEQLAETYRRQADASMDEDAQAEMLFALGDVNESRLQLPSEAVAAYNEVLERRPSHAGARGALERLLASCEEGRGDIIAILEPLYEQDADWSRFADLLVAKVEILEDSFERAEIYSRLTEIAEQELGDQTRALDAAGGWLAEDPQSEDALAQLQRLGSAVQREGEVTARLDGIVAASDSTDVHVRLGQVSAQLKLKLGDIESASKSLEGLLAIDGDDAIALAGMVQVSQHRGDIDRLAQLQWHRAHLSYDPLEKRNLMAEAAQLRLQQGRTADGIEAWLAVLDLDESDVQAHQELAAQYRVSEAWHELVDLLAIAVRYTTDVTVERSLRVESARVYAETLDDLDQGIQAWESVLDLDPQDLEPLDALEALQRKRDDFMAVQEVLLRRADAVQSDVERIAVYLRLAEVAEKDREAPEDSLDFLVRASELDSAHAEVLGHQERLLRSLERWHELVDFHQGRAEACASQGDTPGELRWLAEAADVWEGPIDNPDEAAEILEKILERDPRSVAALTRLAKIYEGASDWERCEETLEKALALGPQGNDAANLFVRLGEVARNKDGDEDKAQQYFGQALHADGYHLVALQYLEEAAREKEDWVLVADMVKRRYQVCQEPKAKLEMVIELADLYGQRLNQPEQVIPMLEVSLNEDPDDARLLGPLADLYFQAGRHDEAAPMFEKLAANAKSKRRMKDVAKYQQRLGGILHAKGDVEAAIVAYESALKVDPSNVQTMAGLGQLYMGKQDWDKARRVYRSMVLQNIDPALGITKADVYFNLGQIHAALEEVPKAKDMFKRALSSDKEHAQAKVALAALG